jgi:hypothetical protein
MTPEYRLTQIIETIRAIRIGAPVSKGGVTLLLEPWPDLITGKLWTGRGWAGSICFRQPPLGSNVSWMTDAAPAACRAYNGSQHLPFPAVADHDGGDWRRRISPGQATRSRIFCRVPVV